MSLRNSNESRDRDLEKVTSIVAQLDQNYRIVAPDWDGPEDTDNPKSWSLGKRLFHSIIPGLFNFVV